MKKITTVETSSYDESLEKAKQNILLSYPNHRNILENIIDSGIRSYNTYFGGETNIHNSLKHLNNESNTGLYINTDRQYIDRYIEPLHETDIYAASFFQKDTYMQPDAKYMKLFKSNDTIGVYLESYVFILIHKKEQKNDNHNGNIGGGFGGNRLKRELGKLGLGKIRGSIGLAHITKNDLSNNLSTPQTPKHSL